MFLLSLFCSCDVWHPMPPGASSISDRQTSETPPILPSGYDAIRRLGGTEFTEVWRARNIKTDRPVAIKFYLKTSEAHFRTTTDGDTHKTPNLQNQKKKAIKATESASIQNALKECSIIRKLAKRCPNIVRIEDVVTRCEMAYIVMEFCHGGTLWDFLKKEKDFWYPDKLLAKVTQNILKALEYMHKVQIVHRDVKPANILLQHPRPLNKDEWLGNPNVLTDVRIADFGYAKEMGSSGLGDACGSAYYTAPEVLEYAYFKSKNAEKYGTACDVWSLGVTVYFLATKWLPFLGSTKHQLFVDIIQDKWVFPDLEFSASCKIFIMELLALDPSRRPTARKALKHKWITFTEQEDSPSAPLSRSQSASPTGLDRSQSASPTGLDRSQSASPNGLDRSQSASPTGLSRGRSGFGSRSASPKAISGQRPATVSPVASPSNDATSPAPLIQDDDSHEDEDLAVSPQPELPARHSRFSIGLRRKNTGASSPLRRAKSQGHLADGPSTSPVDRTQSAFIVDRIHPVDEPFRPPARTQTAPDLGAMRSRSKPSGTHRDKDGQPTRRRSKKFVLQEGDLDKPVETIVRVLNKHRDYTVLDVSTAQWSPESAAKIFDVLQRTATLTHVTVPPGTTRSISDITSVECLLGSGER